MSQSANGQNDTPTVETVLATLNGAVESFTGASQQLSRDVEKAATRIEDKVGVAISAHNADPNAHDGSAGGTGAQTEVETAKEAAEAAQSAAESSASDAAIAATSASDASASATAAANSATTASTKATEAANSATAAKASQTAAEAAKSSAETAAATAKSATPSPTSTDVGKKLVAVGAGEGKWANNASLISKADTRPDDIVENETFTVPAYTVGFGQLRVSLEGCECYPGEEYEEVGDAGATSTSINWLCVVPKDYTIGVFVTP